MVIESFFTAEEMKDGFGTIARVEDLVFKIKSDLENQRSPGNGKSLRVAVGSVLAATDERQCLEHFVQVDGLSLLNEWLQESQRSTESEDDPSVDEMVNVLLVALDKLPIDEEKSTTSGIGSTVSQLLCHKNHEIQEKARSLKNKWMHEVKEPTPEESNLPSVNTIITVGIQYSEEDVKPSEGNDSMIPTSSLNPENDSIRCFEELDEEKEVSHDDGDHPTESMKTSDEASTAENSTPLSSQTLQDESHGFGFDLNEDISPEVINPLSPRERNVEQLTVPKVNLVQIDLNVVHDDDDDASSGRKEKFNVDLNWVETDDGPRHHFLSNFRDQSLNLSTAASASELPPQPRDFDLNYDPSLPSGQSSLGLTSRERSPHSSHLHEDSLSLSLISDSRDEKTLCSGAGEMPRGSIGSSLASVGKSTLSLELEDEQQRQSPGMALKRKEPDCGLDSCKVSTNR